MIYTCYMQSDAFQAFIGLILMIVTYSLWKPENWKLKKCEFYMKSIKQRF